MQFVLSTNARYFPESNDAVSTAAREASVGQAKRALQSSKALALRHEASKEGNPMQKSKKGTKEKKSMGERVVVALERQFPRLKAWLSWDTELQDLKLRL